MLVVLVVSVSRRWASPATAPTRSIRAPAARGPALQGNLSDAVRDGQSRPADAEQSDAAAFDLGDASK